MILYLTCISFKLYRCCIIFLFFFCELCDSENTHTINKAFQLSQNLTNCWKLIFFCKYGLLMMLYWLIVHWWQLTLVLLLDFINIEISYYYIWLLDVFKFSFICWWIGYKWYWNITWLDVWIFFDRCSEIVIVYFVVTIYFLLEHIWMLIIGQLS